MEGLNQKPFLTNKNPNLVLSECSMIPDSVFPAGLTQDSTCSRDEDADIAGLLASEPVGLTGLLGKEQRGQGP